MLPTPSKLGFDAVLKRTVSEIAPALVVVKIAQVECIGELTADPDWEEWDARAGREWGYPFVAQ